MHSAWWSGFIQVHELWGTLGNSGGLEGKVFWNRPERNLQRPFASAWALQVWIETKLRTAALFPSGSIFPTSKRMMIMIIIIIIIVIILADTFWPCISSNLHTQDQTKGAEMEIGLNKHPNHIS